MKKLMYAFLISFAIFVTQSWGQIVEIDYEIKKDSTKTVDSKNQNQSKKWKDRITTDTAATRKGLFSNYLKGATYSLEVPFGLSAVFGLDEYVGDKVEYVEYWNPKTNYDDYNFKYTPLVLDMAPKILWSGAGYVTYENYTFGVKYFSFNKTSSLGGKITTPAPDTTKDGIERYPYNWLRYWGNNLWPLTNTAEPGGASPIWYSANNELKLWSLDVFVSQKIYEDAKNSLSLSYGVKFLKPYYQLQLGLVQHAYIQYYSGWWDFDNWVSINSTHKSKFQGVWKQLDAFLGPSLGISYARSFGNFEITPTVNQAFTFGYEVEDGNFYDVDDIHFYNTKTGAVIPLYFDGFANFYKKQFITLPVTESSLTMAYVVNDYFTVGTAVAYVVYWNMPLGPRWDNPWRQGPWTTKVDNVGIGAMTITTKINF